MSTRNVTSRFHFAAAFVSLHAQVRTVEKSAYTVRITGGQYPSLDVYAAHELIFRLPFVSGLSTGGEEEKLSNIRIESNGEIDQSEVPETKWKQLAEIWKNYLQALDQH